MLAWSRLTDYLRQPNTLNNYQTPIAPEKGSIFLQFNNYGNSVQILIQLTLSNKLLLEGFQAYDLLCQNVYRILN